MLQLFSIMKHTTIGIVAHVDAGKTTLSESLMYNTGKINTLGRVDKGDAFLDTDSIEKERGITIFSKQAILNFGEITATLLDTPGHVDFSAETERTFSVLDLAILVISASDGVQSHTRTIWHLLKSYNVPTLIFVNKMDQPDTNAQALIKNLKSGLSDECVDFSEFINTDNQVNLSESFIETVAACDESTIERFLEGEDITLLDMQNLFYERKLYPVFFGSALKNEGISDFVNSLKHLLLDYSEIPSNKISASFGARVFKISRDNKEERLTHIKITSGQLSVREQLGDEKVTSLRLYDGIKYETVNSVVAGQIVAITGLNNTASGQGLGTESSIVEPLLSPVLSYRLILPKEIDSNDAISKLMKLSEEQPDLSLYYDSDSKSIDICLMGEVQTEILKQRILERFGYEISFGEKKIVYKETIDNIVEGVGHFEPLRHYAEVHLLLEPLEMGSGLVFETNCSEDILDKNWQRLVLTHLKERVHRGVLTGSAITDMKITLVSGRAHIKHTEGGDFRQATYRAVRNGLMQANSHLLEPYYDFVLEVPQEFVGRAMTDLQRLCAKDFSPEIEGNNTILRGYAPVSTLADYGREVTSYTSGLGQLSLSVKGYGPCHNEEEVLENNTYDWQRDLRNTPDSVFCSHGSGIIVPWDEVKNHMHMPSVLTPTKELTDEQIRLRAKRQTELTVSDFVSVEEVDAILGSIASNTGKSFTPHKGINHKKTKSNTIDGITITAGAKPYKGKPILPECLLVDGYNVIYAWPELKELANHNLDGARGALLDILCDYQGMKGIEVIAVFDAYKLQNHAEEYTEYNNIHVVFTKTAQTADYYIERFTKENSKNYRIRVATSDYLEQVIVRGETNTSIVSSREFFDEIQQTKKDFNALHGVK